MKSMRRCSHWRVADPGAIYVGRGRDPRTGQPVGFPWGNPYSLTDYPVEEVVNGYLGHLGRRPDIVEQARLVFATSDACCWCPVPPGPCHGQVLVALGAGLSLEVAGRLWVARRLPGMQPELF